MTKFSPDNIIDVYNDLNGNILRKIFESSDSIPSIIKEAKVLSSSEIDRISDDYFSLVILDNENKFKKFATIDKGNTALSVLYFLEQADRLPPDLQKIAAQNLLNAAHSQNLGISEELKEHIEKHDDDFDKRVNTYSIPGNNMLQVDPFPQKEKLKTASSYERVSPYVEINKIEFTPKIVKQSGDLTLFQDKYPIDSYNQVLEASNYYKNYQHEFHPRDRYTYCVKLASRMKELNMDIPDYVDKYGSNEYSPYIDMFIDSRKAYVNEEYKEALDMLKEKISSVSPHIFVEALNTFDNETGLNWEWGKVLDPWASTFGFYNSMQKEAKSSWKYSNKGINVTQDDLIRLIETKKDEVEKRFGEIFAREFSKDPTTLFDSLPTPHKNVLCVMISSRG